MWALPRASTNSIKLFSVGDAEIFHRTFRAPGLKIAAFRECAGLGPYNRHKGEKFSSSKLHLFKVDSWITSPTCYCRVFVPKLLSVGCRSLSSQAGSDRANRRVSPKASSPSTLIKLILKESGLYSQEGANNANVYSQADASTANVHLQADANNPNFYSQADAISADLYSQADAISANLYSQVDANDANLYPHTNANNTNLYAQANANLYTQANANNVNLHSQADTNSANHYSQIDVNNGHRHTNDAYHYSQRGVKYAHRYPQIDVKHAHRYPQIDVNTNRYSQAHVNRANIPLSPKAFAPTALLKLILEELGPISGALNKFYEGKKLCRFELYHSLRNLRRRKLFKKSLQLTEWLNGREDFDFIEGDYANMLDLIAKVCGLQKAEIYFNDIPESFRQELVYRTLLSNYVSATLVNKSEQVFNQMKKLDFPTTTFTCNQMLLLYKRSDKRKISDVLSLMERKNLSPTLFTYQVLIDLKGRSKDIQGMEHAFEKMKADGLEPTIPMRALLARHYAASGFAVKARDVLKKLERNNTRLIRSLVLPIYAELGNYEEVERIWKIAESRPPQQPEFLAAIDAFGKLKNVKQAEAIFGEMKQKYKKLTSRHYTVMLKVYAENKMLNKGRELLKQMGEDGCYVGEIPLDTLIKLYMDVGDVEKADLILQNATQQDNRLRPMFTSYMAILDVYSERGDVHNAERIYQKMRQAGYVSRSKPFYSLVQAYINAKVPAYGIRDRMKSENIYLKRGLAAQLALLESFNKTIITAT